jgi:hypothetical protein
MLELSAKGKKADRGSAELRKNRELGNGREKGGSQEAGIMTCDCHREPGLAGVAIHLMDCRVVPRRDSSQ